MAWTNAHSQRMFETWFEGSAAPTQFYWFFATSATTPTRDTYPLSSLTLVPSGNGWAGSSIVPKNGNAINVSANLTLDYSEGALSSLTLSANGGDIPITGNPMRWLVLAGSGQGSASGLEVFNYWDLGGNTTIPTGQSFVISNGALRASSV